MQKLYGRRRQVFHALNEFTSAFQTPRDICIDFYAETDVVFNSSWWEEHFGKKRVPFFNRMLKKG